MSTEPYNHKLQEGQVKLFTGVPLISGEPPSKSAYGSGIVIKEATQIVSATTVYSVFFGRSSVPPHNLIKYLYNCTPVEHHSNYWIEVSCR